MMSLVIMILLFGVLGELIRLFKVHNIFTTSIFSCHLISVILILIGGVQVWSFYALGFSLVLTIAYLIHERKNMWHIYMFMLPLLINYLSQLFHMPLNLFIKFSLLVSILVFLLIVFMKDKRYKYELGFMFYFSMEALVMLLTFFEVS